MSGDGTPQIACSLGARVIEVDKTGICYVSFLAVNEAGGINSTLFPNLKFGERVDFGKRVYEKIGAQVIHYDYRTAILVSARRMKFSEK
ncbi:MAG: hypothetical protein QXH55_05825 [Candidatus Korarchaeota archaeon]|nr:hypothetical protein [Thermoproteota archaeon]